VRVYGGSRYAESLGDVIHRLGAISIPESQHADNHLKQEAIDRTATIGTPPGRCQPPDRLIAFLEAL